MDNLEKLYNVLKRDGYITKSFDEFVDQATQDADYQDKIFNVVSRENLFTGGPDEFSEKYFSELATSPVEGVKKKTILNLLLQRKLRNQVQLWWNNLDHRGLLLR